ncbi:hypothetical protein [Rhizobium sp. Root708]|uniref:hypothetical protein n=1 Tax=Rhizobium sp. Root708 TaxID=1736592 RepID=UPI001FCCE568|nr:hypothetical protein [Rhizobium sp. Root708]
MARKAAGLPASRVAVATVMAASTPIEACTRWGMALRVEIVPSLVGAETSVIFGTQPVATSPISSSARAMGG